MDNAQDRRPAGVCSVVVTYNRLPLLQRLIGRLRVQTASIDAIYVVDNGSTDGTSQWLSQQADLRAIRQENLGSAGGMRSGLALALKAGHDWFWCMDDDAQPMSDALQKLLEHAADYRVLNSVVVDEKNPARLAFAAPDVTTKAWRPRMLRQVAQLEALAEHGLYPWAFLYNATLIHRSALDKVGLPNAGLFIWGDEVDFFLRLKHHFDVACVLTSRTLHPASDIDPRSVPRWKFQYRVRNQAYISSRYGTFRHVRVLKNLARFIRERPTDSSVADVVSATFAGLRGQLGKI